MNNHFDCFAVYYRNDTPLNSIKKRVEVLWNKHQLLKMLRLFILREETIINVHFKINDAIANLLNIAQRKTFKIFKSYSI
jgi:hypothetical protein